jgi:acyl-CoA thioesterase FadM
MKHYFSFNQDPTKTLIDRLIEMCTADGSVVNKIKIDYKRVRTFGNDLNVKIWTKKEQSK